MKNMKSLVSETGSLEVVHTVENGLIVRMEEYANTAEAERLF